ncbi:MAG: hypothetical protein HRU35_03185 [Rickettsiaceae bacterium]|nr:hypothetical protein [Rickettsiaceae bacterium]
MSKKIIQYKTIDQYTNNHCIFKGSIKHLDIIDSKKHDAAHPFSPLAKPTSAREIEKERQAVPLDKILKPSDPLLVHIQKLTFCQKYIDDPKEACKNNFNI